MFRKQARTLPTSPTEYPHGTFIKTEKGYFYILNDAKRYRLVSKRVLDSWAPHRVVETTEAAVKNYRITAKMKFRNGSLIHNIADGKVYLIEDGKRRALVSPEAYELLGIEKSREYITSVSLSEIQLHELGEDLA